MVKGDGECLMVDEGMMINNLFYEVNRRGENSTVDM